MNDSPEPRLGKAESAAARRAVTTAAIIIVLSLFVVGVYAWLVLGASAMSASGYLALALGVLGTVGLGVGLMVLVFYSHRYGYDDRAAGGDRPPGRD
jgi:hypothetical protein